MDWERGAVIGRGNSGGVVHLAYRRNCFPETFAVKSVPVSSSSLLRREEAILDDLRGCPHVITCLGHDTTIDSTCGMNNLHYNLFLEYASGGSISSAIIRAGGGLPELTVRRYLRSILLGLHHIHAIGYVHCDIKPQNILLFDGEAKIADFGLAKKATERVGEEIRGTPMYMAPESAARKEYEAAADIWAVGCTVVEMVSGQPPWSHTEQSHNGIWALLLRIGSGDAVPDIPQAMSEEGKDFLRRCFEKEPSKRWTAEMLLWHPFASFSSETEPAEEAMVEAAECSDFSTSPKSVLGYSFPSVPWSPPGAETEDWFLLCVAAERAYERIMQLASEERPDWANGSPEDDEGWINVREEGSPSGEVEAGGDEVFPATSSSRLSDPEPFLAANPPPLAPFCRSDCENRGGISYDWGS